MIPKRDPWKMQLPRLSKIQLPRLSKLQRGRRSDGHPEPASRESEKDYSKYLIPPAFADKSEEAWGLGGLTFGVFFVWPVLGWSAVLAKLTCRLGSAL